METWSNYSQKEQQASLVSLFFSSIKNVKYNTLRLDGPGPPSRVATNSDDLVLGE